MRRDSAAERGDLRILLLEAAELILDTLESVRFGALCCGLVGGGLGRSIGTGGAVWLETGGDVLGERRRVEGVLRLVCEGGEEAWDGHCAYW